MSLGVRIKIIFLVTMDGYHHIFNFPIQLPKYMEFSSVCVCVCVCFYAQVMWCLWSF